ncbi:Matrix metalloproteinase-14, partial [Orchesella cincta]
MSNGNTYAFNGNRVHRFSPDGVYVGSRRISAAFPGLPNELDSAFTLNNRTYFFKGSQYWRFTNGRGDDGYPKPISEGFSGIPPNIDAAFVWEGNGKIYFFKRHLYWRFDPARTPPISHDYPKSISSWSGILENIDAALTGKGYTYFFKGDQYWKFNDRTFSIETSDPPFPRPLGKWWFGCPEIEK